MDAAIVWFRQDLRLEDNPALNAALSAHQHIIPLYILDDLTPGLWSMGGAQRWWLDQSLKSLDHQLQAIGSKLILRRGDPRVILTDLCKGLGVRHVYWNRLYEPFARERDGQIKQHLKDAGYGCSSYNGSLLFEPWEIAPQGGGFFKVFTPFWKACLKRLVDRPLTHLPPPLSMSIPPHVPTDLLSDLDLYPQRGPIPHWAAHFGDMWTPGSIGAQEKLDQFIHAVTHYKSHRDRPDLNGTSQLSPHLHFGEISLDRLVRTVTRIGEPGIGSDTFLSEIGWREFSYHLLYHVPTLPDTPFRESFSRFPWQEDRGLFHKWCSGTTGYPIVDAGMRQLWRTGWMHNRVRMITASFLTKHLLIPWQEGARWFWDTLVDADLASNSASWQWVAGSGADAAPYFRIFNPILQGQRFDPDGTYVRTYIPELAQLPADVIHAPWTAAPHVLTKANVLLGRTYPQPCIDHGTARERALNAYQAIRAAGDETPL